jgi:indole-3-glycerol phosphate synthase
VSILDEILASKVREIERGKAQRPPVALAAEAERYASRPRSLRLALSSTPSPRILAEIKRRSPSRGEIRADFDPSACARAYAEHGAAALSVLTDEPYFGGRLEYLAAARAQAPDLPLLRKDFLIDVWQIDEARVAGADAVLLIVAALAPEALRALLGYARQRGMEALVEVHDERELEVALGLGADLVGVNNRNLRTFDTDLGVTERLARRVPPGVVLVSESGIATNEDVRRLEAAGAHAFLVGESLMREADPGLALRRLRGVA